MTQSNNTQPKPRKVRGTGTYVGDEFKFTPYEQGEPAQRNVKTCKGGKVYETSSEKSPMRVAYLTCAANAADPWSEYTSQLERLGIMPLSEKRLPAKQLMVSEGGMEVYLNQKQQQLIYQGTIDLQQSHNWQSEVMRQLQIIVRTLPALETFKKVITKLKKGGMK